MKVCLINGVYGVGSTGKIVRALHHALRQEGQESLVICSDRNAFTAEDGVFTISNRFLNGASAAYRRLTARQYEGARIQTDRLLAILRREKPDVVHLHCINGNNIHVYRLLRYLADSGTRTLLTLHAEFPYTGGCEHAFACEKWLTGCGGCPHLEQTQSYLHIDGTARTWRLWKACYDRFSPSQLTVTAVSPWLAGRAQQAPQLGRFPIHTVLNPIDTAVYRLCPDATVRRRYGLSADKALLLHVTARFDPADDGLKGGSHLAALARRFAGRPVQIAVAANYAAPGELPDNITYLGKITDNRELAALYTAADATVITSRRETFSMVTAESLCCGTPVVGFEAGGPESIALPGYGSFVPYGDDEGLYRACLDSLARPINRAELAGEAARKYGTETVLKAYLALYNG